MNKTYLEQYYEKIMKGEVAVLSVTAKVIEKYIKYPPEQLADAHARVKSFEEVFMYLIYDPIFEYADRTSMLMLTLFDRAFLEIYYLKKYTDKKGE